MKNNMANTRGRKEKVIQFRVNDEEKEALEKQMRVENFSSLAGWLRKIALDRASSKRWFFLAGNNAIYINITPNMQAVKMVNKRSEKQDNRRLWVHAERPGSVLLSS